MKNTTIKLLKHSVLLPAVLFACLVATAQRGDRNGRGGGPDRGGSFNQQRSGGFANRGFERNNTQQRMGGIQRGNDMPARNFNDRSTTQQPTLRQMPDRSFSNRADDRSSRPGNVYNRPERGNTQQATPEQRPDRTFPNRADDRNSRPSTAFNRPDQRDRYDNRSFNNNRNNNSVNVNRNVTVYNRNNGYYGNRGGYYQQHRNYYPTPFRYTYNYPRYGQRYTSLNFNFNIIPFGGIGYRYYSGVFYRPFGSYFQVVAPPVGICINVLPFGYSRFYYGDMPYYFYGNTFYREYNNYYQVVEPPLGAKLPALPRGAEEVYINGERYFEDNGTYYLEEFNERNQRLYTVVGVNGVLDREQVDRIINGTSAQVMEQPGGDVYSELPADSRKVSINGHDYYRSPDDVYYEEITDGSTVSYQVVGK